ncbi:MAG: glycerate kinase [Actinomycetota bacterium]|nr:glycerate kinase [Actinomycetota bacterium]
MLKILIACDKYKGSLTANQVCNTIAGVIKDLDESVIIETNPMADGGDGTLETLVESLGGKYIKAVVKDPLGKDIETKFGMLKSNIAVIEMASASGLWMLPFDKRNPMETTTYGTGQLIKEAIDKNAKKIILGIGGSATNDGGMGMAQALGIRFYDENENLLGYGGKQLQKIKKIDMTGLYKKAKDVLFECACDVENPLTGKNGAAYVYAAQKGADSKMIRELNRGLINFAKVIKNDLGKNIRDLKGAGASGGLGGGMVAFLNAKLRIGVNIIMDVTGIEEKIKGADLVITGEGAFDRQTFFGKSAFGVASLAKKHGIPVITINGSVLIDRKNVSRENNGLFAGNFSIINKPMDLNDAVENADELLYNSTRELMNFFLKSMRFKK